MPRSGRRRKKEIQQTDSPMQMIFYLVDSESEHVHVYFRRPKEESEQNLHSSSVYISLYHPRQGILPSSSRTISAFVYQGQTVAAGDQEILYALEYELPHKKLPCISAGPHRQWLDRLSTGVQVFSLIHLPKHHKRFNFVFGIWC